ncbi:MAG: hypothetical protein ACC645_15050, partial [Pirellulales bacterium]
MNKIEQWKQEKHGFDVWPDVLRYAESQTPVKAIDPTDLERMKWHGVLCRKRDGHGSYMLRIRITACELTARQAKEVAYIAYEFGHGLVDITTRANLQVQGLSIEHVPRAVARLEACGLTARQTGHDNIRNVFGHPLSGIDPHELIDTRVLCREITGLFIDDRVYADLPRKMNIAVSGRLQHALAYWGQDISFLACHSPEGETVFQVLVGGTLGQNPHLGWHLPVHVLPEQVVDVTRALLDLFRERGSRERRDRARFRYLVEAIGVGGVLAHLEERPDAPLQPPAAEPQPPTSYDDLIGWFPQLEDDRWAMGLGVTLGRMTWQQLEGLGRLSQKWGDGQLRTTPDQGIVVAGIRRGFRSAPATDAAASGLSPLVDSLSQGTVACTGKQFCNIAVTETKGHMLQLIDKLRRRGVMLHGIRIHMSGCPSACAQHHLADIGLKGVRVRRLLGTREGFDVYLGGGLSGRLHLAMPYRLGVDIDQLPQVIDEVIRKYYLKHKAGQTFSAYWREKLRDLEAEKVSDQHYSPPTWVCDGCGYRHLAEDPPIFCPRCAGLRRHFARLEADAPAAGPAEKPNGDNRPAVEETPASVRADGFVVAARADDVVED